MGKNKTTLNKGKHTSGNANPVPAKKAENKVSTVTSNKNSKRDLRKEIEARSRARRMRSMLKKGMTKEQVEEVFAQENNRMVLVLLHGNYTVQDGMKKIKDKEVPNILRGFAAAKKYVDDNKLTFMSGSSNAIWILTDKDHVEDVSTKLNILGRVSITKPEVNPPKKEKSVKKPTGNTAAVKKAAKDARKKHNIEGKEMRPYYAALRKGGVKARIKKYNPTLADKIEKWIKEHKKAEAEKADRIDKHKRDHRQMSSLEMKANKRARKAAKHLAAQERRKAADLKRAENNAKIRAKRAQKAQKPVQTELKAAA
jgi:hypothetical protein